MPNNRNASLADIEPKMLRAQSESDRAESEGDRKLLADRRRLVGRRVERALALAGVSKQEAAHSMGYRDPGVISRWCSGVERPLFDKLFEVDGFEQAWIVALAQQHPGMEVETVVKIRRTV